MLSLRLSESTEKLRKDFELWLKSNPAPEITGRIELEEFVEVSTDWQRTLAQDRWIAVHWPEQYGGRGLSLLDEAVIQESLAAAGAPQLINLFGLTMVGPVLIKHGTEQQRQRFLPKILSAEEIWCQGFSEPQAGSDLAAVRTAAERVEGGWEISGQKIWTSFAQYAQWCFVLTRTEQSEARHKGLSYFLIPMAQQSIDVRPLTQISGDREFNEIFFDRAFTAEENLVGSAGQGWEIAISTLMYERVILTFARHLQSEAALAEIAKLLRSDLVDDEREIEYLRQYGRLKARNMSVRALALSHLVEYDSRHPGPEGSLDKLAWSEAFQDICRFALEIQGARAVVTGGAHAAADGSAQHRYLYSRGRTIAAGTSEIQRNIIAERVLGLPRA